MMTEGMHYATSDAFIGHRLHYSGSVGISPKSQSISRRVFSSAVSSGQYNN